MSPGSTNTPIIFVLLVEVGLANYWVVLIVVDLVYTSERDKLLHVIPVRELVGGLVEQCELSIVSNVKHFVANIGDTSRIEYSQLAKRALVEYVRMRAVVSVSSQLSPAPIVCLNKANISTPKLHPRIDHTFSLYDKAQTFVSENVGLVFIISDTCCSVLGHGGNIWRTKTSRL